MAKRNYPRIEIDQRAYDALQAEGILQHRTVREIATDAILEYVSKEAIKFVDQRFTLLKGIATAGPQDYKTIIPEDIATKRPLDQTTTKGMEIERIGPRISQKRKRLADNPEALQKIKVMLSQNPKPSLLKMGEQIGYPKSTIAERIKAMKKSGELAD